LTILNNVRIGMNNCIVVGGGLCGLFSSIILADKFKKVYIIDTDAQCGGLLKSVKDELGIVYDQGTHIPNTTGVKEIDNILFGPEPERKQHWQDLGKLKTGNFFNGQWDLETQIVDTRKLPEQIYQKGILELLTLTEQSNAEDIATYLNDTIGPTFTSEIAYPLVKKIYGQDVDATKLKTNSSVSYFGLSRVLGLNSEVTKKLKELPAFDDKLGYHSTDDYNQRVILDGTVEPTYYYPTNGKGVQYWIDGLIAQAKTKGVEFLTQESISKIEHENGSITKVHLAKSNLKLECDFLFWSAPPALALHAAGVPSKKVKLDFRTANIFHYNFDLPILNSESHYIWNWDLDAKSFRVTLHPNLDKNKHTNHLTIEALSGRDDYEEITSEDMLNELINMGLISKEAKVISQLRQTIHNTFPVPTFEFSEATKDNYDKLSQEFINVMVSGRFSGKYWFHGDVIKAAYDEIQLRFS